MANIKPHSTGYLIVLERGDALIQSLEEVTLGKGIKSAWLSGIGGALKVELGFYDLQAKRYNWQTFEDTLEVTNLSGNLTLLDGKPFFHLRGNFSRSNYTVVGGHVRDLVVGGTMEINLEMLTFDSGDEPNRSYSDAIGLNLIT